MLHIQWKTLQEMTGGDMIMEFTVWSITDIYKLCNPQVYRVEQNILEHLYHLFIDGCMKFIQITPGWVGEQELLKIPPSYWMVDS